MKGKGFRSVCVIVGCALILCSLVLLLGRQFSLHRSAETAAKHTDTIRRLLPEFTNAAPETRYNNTMPVLSVEKVDYVGLISFPAHDSELPVRAEWNGRLYSPCRYDGSIYDGSLIVGANTQKGQYDFFHEIGVTDTVFFTDMTGNRYSLEVSDILYRTGASESILYSEKSDLTLFIKNLNELREYIIVYCRFK